MKTLRRLLLVLLVLVLPPLVLCGWLFATDSGLQAGVRGLQHLLGPALAIESVQGRLAGRSEWQGVSYESADFRFSAQRLELDWSPGRLMAGVLEIAQLAARDVHYEQRTVTEDDPDAPVELPQRITLPLALRLQAAVVEHLSVISAPGQPPLVFERIALAAGFDDAELTLRGLEIQHAQLQLQGEAALETAGDYRLHGQLQAQAALPGHAPMVSETLLSGSLRELRIEHGIEPPYALQAGLVLHDLLAQLQLDAAIDLQGSALRDINPDWPELQLAGRLLASGTTDALQLDASLDLQDAVAGALQLVFAGQWQPDALQVATLQLSAAGQPARLDGQGRIGLGEQPVFDFTADWQALVWPLQGEPDLRSQRGHFTLQGSAADYRLELNGDLQAAGWLSGDLQLQAHSLPEAGNWQIEQAVLAQGGSQVQLRGQAGETFALDWSIDSDNLAELVPQVGGQLAGNGQVSGTLDAPALQTRLSGTGLSWQDYRLGQLSVQGTVDMAGKQRSQLAVALRDASQPGMTLNALDFTLAGRPRQHELQLSASTTQGSLDWLGGGDWDGARWVFAFRRADLAWEGLPPWQLDDTLRGRLSSDGALALERGCWRSQQAHACLQLQAGAGKASGEVTLDELAASYFAPLLPPDLEIETVLAMRADFTADGGRLRRAHVTLDAVPGSVRRRGQDEEQTIELGFDAVQAQLEVNDSRAQLDMTVPLSGAQGEIKAHATLHAAADNDWLQGRLQGGLTLHWPDVALAAQWLPEVSALSGRLDGQVQVSGTPAAPQLQGRVELGAARATLDRPGLELENIALSLEGTPQGMVRVNAGMDSGGGHLQGSGEYRLEDGSGRFRIEGEKFQLAGLPELSVFVSPGLDVELAPELVRVRGAVAIPRAAIRPHRPPSTAVSASADQIIIRPEQEAAAQGGWPLDVDVAITVGDKVKFKGFGLGGSLHGKLRIIDPPQQPATASGELAVRDGLYQAYGQDLTITTGRLLYAGGALDEPGLDIEAVRKPAPDITVGVKVRGNLKQPKLTVFSQPSMTQSEQLSWLVMGRSMQGSSGSEQSALGAAALAMGMGTGESIGQEVGGALGLDTVDISNEPGADVSQSSLLVGKYLTPELFVSYGIGLFEPLSTLKLRYALSSRWKLVGVTSVLGSSADLMYELDRH